MSTLNKMKLTLALFLFLGTNILSSGQDLCPYAAKECTCESSLLICKDLNTLPPLMSDNLTGSITSILFLYGNLGNVPANSLPPHLKEIQFISTHLTNISPDAFNGSANTLDFLFMGNTNYNQVPTALLKVNNLTSLTINGDKITEWNSTVMSHIAKSVDSLTLSNVSILTWPEFFQNFLLVNSVDFSHNNISSIPRNAFTNRLHLTSLKLRGNHLGDVVNVDNALQPVATTLEYLDLGANQLPSIPPSVVGMTSLSDLDVSFNSIDDITNAFPPQLKHLYLNKNNIKQLTDKTFTTLTALETLGLDNNPLSYIPNLAFQPLQNLRELDLESIGLTTIPPALTSLKSLQILNLGYNFHCPCSRNEQLVGWYYSLKNLTVNGYCYWNVKPLKDYFHNETYQQVCSGNNLNYNRHLYAVVLVLFSFSIL